MNQEDQLQNATAERDWLLVVALALCVIVPLSPFLVNGAPFIGDSWIHLGIARNVSATGSYSLIDYGERWPSLNLLIVFMMLVPGIEGLYASQVVPVLAGLAVFPFYGFCRRLGLSKAASIFAALALTANPLYAYVTFAGAVMRETATYFLIPSMLLVTTMLVREPHSRSALCLALLLGSGIVMGHHFGGLMILVFLWVLVAYVFVRGLESGFPGLRGLLIATLWFTIIFVGWDAWSYWTLRSSFPIGLGDLALLPAMLIVTSYMLYRDRGVLSSKAPWLIGFAFLAAVAGLRGGIYILAQPTAPMTIWELSMYAIVGVVTLTGLAIGLRSLHMKAFAAATTGMLLFAFLWGLTADGFVLLIKSLHYFGLLLALGAGFMAQRLLVKRAAGKAILGTLLLFIVCASVPGTMLALNGLGAYRIEEVQTATALTPVLKGVNVYGDTRVSYLLPYTSNMTVKGLMPTGNRTSSKLVFLLFKPNWEQGFLQGYDWIPKDALMRNEDLSKWNLVWNSGVVRIYS